MAVKPLDKIIRRPMTDSMNIIMEQMTKMVSTVKTTVLGRKMDPWHYSLMRTTKNCHKRLGGNNRPTRETGAGRWRNHGIFNTIWNTDPTRNTKIEENGLQTAGGGTRHWAVTNSGVHRRTICGRIKRRVICIIKQPHPHHAFTTTYDTVQVINEREYQGQGIFYTTVDTTSNHLQAIPL